MIYRYLLLSLCAVIILPLCGQSDKLATELLETRKQTVYSHHEESYVAGILTGKQFTDYSNKFKQFFLGKYTSRGSLVYDEVLFEDIELQYNIFNQEVIALLETHKSERYVVVRPDKVSAFSVYGHDFVHLPGDSVMASGIYELAYDGVKSSVFIKRTSVDSKTVEGNMIKIEYEPVNKYFVRNQYGTFQISGKKKLIQAYQKSPQLIRIIKTNRIKFSKKAIAQGLVEAVSKLEEIEYQ